MKEVLTKSFWQGVKKTFYEAMEPEPAKIDTAQTPAAAKEKAGSTEEKPSSPSAREEKE